MAVRNPLKIYGTGLQEMSSANIDTIIWRMVYLYFTDPSVTLSVVSTNGNLASMYDTRMSAGASLSSVSSFHPESSTAEPGNVSVEYDKITQTLQTAGVPSDTSNIRFPIYQSGGNIHAMTLTDMYETFAQDAVDTIMAQLPYKIHTHVVPPTGYSLVSSTPVFSNTIANVSAYSYGSIPEAVDQPTTVTNYYLNVKTGVTPSSSIGLMYIDASQNVREYTQAQLDVVLKELIRYACRDLTNHKLRFITSLNGNTETVLGSGLTNTKLDGDGNYQQRYVNTDDYRTQEFPNGTSTATHTYYLKARKE